MAQPGDDWPPLAVDVPDDARELDRDVAAYHREVRSLRRRAFFERFFLVRRLGRYGLAGPIGIGVLIVVAAVGSLLALLVPSTGPRPAALPLASPDAAPGSVGGLVPAADLRSPGQSDTFSSQKIRPAIIALVPSGCDCPEVIRHLAGQAAEYRLPLLVVTAESDDAASAAEISPDRGAANAISAYDEKGTLARAYRLTDEPVAVLVHADGVVEHVARGVDATTPLEPYLGTLDRAYVAPSA